MRGRRQYLAHIQRTDGTRVWICDHSHEGEEAARQCGQAELELRQDPGTPLNVLKRPQMAFYGDVAGFHAPVPGLSDRAWSEVVEICRGCCRYCGSTSRLEREHRVPISRGGANRIKNIVASCHACNAAKASSTEKEYLAALRVQWGKRVPRSPRNLDQRLAAIERRYAKDIRQGRGEGLLKSLGVPARVWSGLVAPESACFAVQGQETQKLAGVTFHGAAVESVLGDRDSWEGRIVLVPQRGNPHDPMAVAVFKSGHHIGFLPAPVAHQLHEDLLSLLLSERKACVTKLRLHRWDEGYAGKVYLALPFRTRSA